MAARGDNFVALACTVLIGLKNVMNKWTDPSTIAKMREALYAVVRKKAHAKRQRVTCHMGTHGVTCHLTQVNAPCPNPSRTGWY